MNPRQIRRPGPTVSAVSLTDYSTAYLLLLPLFLPQALFKKTLRRRVQTSPWIRPAEKSDETGCSAASVQEAAHPPTCAIIA